MYLLINYIATKLWLCSYMFVYVMTIDPLVVFLNHLAELLQMWIPWVASKFSLSNDYSAQLPTLPCDFPDVTFKNSRRI